MPERTSWGWREKKLYQIGTNMSWIVHSHCYRPFLTVFWSLQTQKSVPDLEILTCYSEKCSPGPHPGWDGSVCTEGNLTDLLFLQWQEMRWSLKKSSVRSIFLSCWTLTWAAWGRTLQGEFIFLILMHIKPFREESRWHKVVVRQIWEYGMLGLPWY